MSKIENLDSTAAQYAQKIVNQKNIKAKDLENQITKSLGVLQEQGIYALMLFLFAQDNNATKAIYENLIELLQHIDLESIDEGSWPTRNDGNEYNHQQVLKFYSDNILKGLDKLFLVRDLYEQTLIYARYGAKASGKAEKKNDSKNDASAGS